MQEITILEMRTIITQTVSTKSEGKGGERLTFNKDATKVLEVLDDALAEGIFSKEGLDADDASLQAVNEVLGGGCPV